MKHIFPFVSLFLLTGCVVPQNPLTGTGSVRDLIHTASGYVLEAGKQAAALRLRSGQAIELGKIGIQKGKETFGNLQERVGQVKEGIEAVKEGKELIEKGIGTK